MLMMKTFLLFAALAVADGATTVAVLEFGKHGCVRRTTATNTRTTVAGANSFFRALSGKGLQQSGMTVVPDLFNKPDGMVVVGISGSGVDLNSMPILSNLVQSEGNGVVGHMTLPEAHHRHLMNHVGPSKSIDTASFVDGVKAEASSKILSSVSIDVDVGNSGAVDAQIAAMISALQKQAGSDSTIIVHLVVEEEDGAFRRRLSENGGAEDNQNQRKAQDDEEDGNGDGSTQYNNAYYGYGYYNTDGEWVTPFKTMFQIQYFNIVLWTSVGLVVMLFFVVYLMINMPLEADTLLFGESAKIGD
ncbi:hypothetical protein MHU86_7807 [Fragilaria crotonensis]|nr:hypothetical protein MHU86_7807 [Fragilaria crotonensis]